MKKYVLAALLVCFVTIFTVPSFAKSSKIQVCATIFPQYDWLRNITKGSENIEISLLVQNGTDMHSFQPKVSDIVKISSSDMFVFIGGESDEWCSEILKKSSSGKTLGISLLDVLNEKGRSKIETSTGIAELKKESEEEETDEHIWLSLKNTVVLCEYLCEKISLIDKPNSSLYKKNCEEYIGKLVALDKKFEETAGKISKTLVFADRFPFLYFTEDYGLKYLAAFSGCSTETDANFKTILTLAKKIDEENISNVIIIENSTDSIAKTVIKATQKKSAQIVILDSIQSVSKKMIDSGVTYLGIMEKNLEVLKNLSK